jgi:predicted lipoprotein with Yx(FWY)xxD motif
MKLKLGVGIAIASIAVFGLSACSAAKSSSQPAAGGLASTAPAYNAPASTAGTTGAAVALGTATSSLGTIVVDGKGMTVYEYGKDVKGAASSTCTGQCAKNWPAVPGGTSAPALKGVTGTVATIKGVDGKAQLTLNGWPLYYYAGDTAAGQTSGQGVGSIWWVLSPAGAPISK